MVGIGRMLSMGLAFAIICAAQTPTFEVASIKPAQPGATGRSFTQRPGGGLVTSNATIRMLMAFAYQVMPEEISGGPPWAESDGFDIDAKGTGPRGHTIGIPSDDPDLAGGEVPLEDAS